MAKLDPPFQILPILDDAVDQTLAAFLKQSLKCRSWGEARKVVAQRRVQLNGNLCVDPARRLTQRDVVKVWKNPLPKPVDENAVRFVYVDEDILVVDKPPRITSSRHYEERNLRSQRRQLQPTLEEILPLALAKYIRHQRAATRRAERTGETFEELPGKLFRNATREEDEVKSYATKLKVIAVHRLDRDTSGLMIFARNQKTAVLLGKLFRAHAVDRRYQAVVRGQPQSQTFESYLVRDRGDGHRGSTTDPNAEGAQHAITHIRPVESIGPYTLIECKLETGRTHQIRIHLSEAGYPLCGDPIYFKRADGTTTIDTSRAPRQALHSSALRFVHPTTGKILKFTLPLPHDLERWLRGLRDGS